jgi:toxin ParE1/3/4
MAEAILEKFIQARDSLRLLPDRGRIPPELKRVNILSYREIQLHPYRIIYRIYDGAHAVHIHIVADGRRNFTELLKERLLGQRERRR